MSAQSALRVAPARAPRPSSPQAAPQTTPRLLLVRAPAQTRTRVPFVLVCMAILGGALLTALLLNTTMASGAYEKHDLDRELARLSVQEQDLAAELDRRSSPSELAAAARALGMVRATSPAWLQLSDGSVLGAPTPVGAAG
ncbi:hypothetical protein [Cellulomonas sp. NS3]|uniref:hypothetical protein n=1 Tax=Cellulomonas sp. NS3 TaxID=2973977 RepID=UPI002163612F|nr:hypothetical protein [Cellulomonas sp. NS3]